jgi:site-specific recombinase XerD
MITIKPADSHRWAFWFMKLSEAIEKFKAFYGFKVKAKSLSGYELDLRQFCLYMHNPEIASINDEHITSYLSEMLNLGWKQNGLMPKSIALRKFFEYWSNKGVSVVKPDLIPIPQREYKMPRVAEMWEYEKVMKALPKDSSDSRVIRNRAIINLLYDTGARVGEIVSLNIDDIDFINRVAVIKTEKSRGISPIRRIFWEEETNDDLKEWIKIRGKIAGKTKFRDPKALFVGVRNWQTGKRLTNSAVSIFMRHLSRELRLPRTLNPHSFRHLKGNDLSRMGANNSTISQILGHSSLASSYIYTMMNGKELGDVAKSFNEKRRDLNK